MDSYRERMIYFARPVTFYPYHTLNQGIVEAAANSAMGWPRHYRILDPNDELLSKVYNNLKTLGDPDAFQIFSLVARSCDHILGVAFSDGALGAGVSNELAAFFNTAPLRQGRTLKAWTVTPIRSKHAHIGATWQYVVYNHVGFDSVKAQHKLLTIPETRERVHNGVL